MKNILIIVSVLLCILLIITGIASADVLPQAPDETQSLKLVTSVKSDGVFNHNSFIGWDLSSEFLGVNVLEVEPGQHEVFPEPPLNPAGEVQMYCTYTEDTQAFNGVISFDKTGTLDTGSMTGSEWNIENERMITFTGYDAGSVLSQEQLYLGIVGTPIITAFSTICPFAQDMVGNCIPPFCNQIGVESDINLDTFSLVSIANLHNVNPQGDPGFYPPIPTADDPVKLFFSIEVTGSGADIPAQGSIATKLDLHKKEGGAPCPGFAGIAQQVDVEEIRQITGRVNIFKYVTEYESGIEAITL